MTNAQLKALEVLASVDPPRCVDAWRQGSQARPVPHVNQRAVDSLVEHGLAEVQLALHGAEYRITPQGVRVLGSARRRRA